MSKHMRRAGRKGRHARKMSRWLALPLATALALLVAGTVLAARPGSASCAPVALRVPTAQNCR